MSTQQPPDETKPLPQQTVRAVEEREAAYWDDQASGLTNAVLLQENVDLDASNRCRLTMLGDVHGKRVLDVGCGTGLWAVFLAKQGAEVWAVDISPHSIAATQRRTNLHSEEHSVHASVMSATALEFPEGFFDLVHGQDIVHHLDADPFGREIARVLAPGGKAVFSENCANNGLLMFARNHLCGHWGIPKWSSDDEYPLTRKKLAVFSRFFAQTSVLYPQFAFFLFLDAKLFRYKNKLVSSVCGGLDTAIYNLLPFMRQYSYRQIVCCRKSSD